MERWDVGVEEIGLGGGRLTWQIFLFFIFLFKKSENPTHDS